MFLLSFCSVLGRTRQGKHTQTKIMEMFILSFQEYLAICPNYFLPSLQDRISYFSETLNIFLYLINFSAIPWLCHIFRSLICLKSSTSA